jgi:hypothetical protein
MFRLCGRRDRADGRSDIPAPRLNNLESHLPSSTLPPMRSPPYRPRVLRGPFVAVRRAWSVEAGGNRRSPRRYPLPPRRPRLTPSTHSSAYPVGSTAMCRCNFDSTRGHGPLRTSPLRAGRPCPAHSGSGHSSRASRQESRTLVWG